jgi:hypothetical protein
MIQSRFTLLAALLAPLLTISASAEETRYDIGGRVSGELAGVTYPEDSIFREFGGATAKDAIGVARVILKADRGDWNFRTDYQFAHLHGDSVELTNALPPGLGGSSGRRLPNDDRRLFDLTHVISEGDDYVTLHRLDRLSIGHTSEKTVLRFGRQAISWGNGMIYNPVDIFNPFDPAAVDKEYKAGDDLLYSQYLTDSGSDLQGVMVFRRNLETGDVDKDSSALAFKYHDFWKAGEYDLLLAENYGDTLASVGGNVGVGGAIVRGDLVVSFTDSETVAQFVTSYSESWTWGGKNVSGVLEYFYNGFGQPAGEYSPAEILDNPDLAARLVRGELFTLGRHYLALSTAIEMTPLFVLVPNAFINLEDPSALLQLVTQNSLSDDMTLLGAINLPVGPSGSEFGGPESGIPGEYLSTGLSLSLQLNWYF